MNRRAFFATLLALLVAHREAVYIDPWTETLVGRGLLRRGVHVIEMRWSYYRSLPRSKQEAINATRARFDLCPAFSRSAQTKRALRASTFRYSDLVTLQAQTAKHYRASDD